VEKLHGVPKPSKQLPRGVPVDRVTRSSNKYSGELISLGEAADRKIDLQKITVTRRAQRRASLRVQLARELGFAKRPAIATSPG
jgi:hypothetical protein